MVLLESLKVPLGEPAKDFSLAGVDDKTYSLADFVDAPVLVVVFMCNHCPYVQAVWERLVKLQARYLEMGVQFVGINPNLNPEYPEENIDKMKEYAQRYQMNFPYLLDESQQVAREYKAQCTPDIYVYDAERRLAYHGRIDDNWKDQENVAREELSDTIQALLDGKRPPDEQYPSMGCSIKWRNN